MLIVVKDLKNVNSSVQKHWNGMARYVLLELILKSIGFLII
ncbi:hypothetical protein [Wolbachia endosymbiont of Dipetalonema caudispina]|nr:hypothetical protein [Wolbachia endosymbiont of Dipetalonema caudispina]